MNLQEIINNSLLEISNTVFDITTREVEECRNRVIDIVNNLDFQDLTTNNNYNFNMEFRNTVLEEVLHQVINNNNNNNNDNIDHFLDSLTIINYESIPENTECTICLNMTNFSHDEVIKLSCNHYFHKKCIKTWFLHSKTCPICKSTCY